MNGWEIAVLVVVCISFAVALGIIIRNKIKGKSCCGDCKCCSCCAKKKEHAKCK